jgi:hypothetical protein
MDFIYFSVAFNGPLLVKTQRLSKSEQFVKVYNASAVPVHLDSADVP